MKKYSFAFLLLSLAAVFAYAQEKDLGDKEYVIVKDYKPVLADSYKISETPEGDTSFTNPPKMDYQPAPRKLETNFEAGVIKAVRIKEEPITKLYKTLVKLGIGNYSTYYAEGFYNAIRSKTGQLGVHAKHLSAKPKLDGVIGPYFSSNMGEVYGKYFLDHATLDGSFGYDRRVVHFYGIDSDQLISDPDSTRQLFNHFSLGLGIKSNWISDDHLDYHARFEFHNLGDDYDVTENNFIVKGGAGKKFDENYFGLNLSFDYFSKNEAEFEKLNLYSDLSRNIVDVNPYFKRDFDKIRLNVGFRFTIEKNLESKAHFYPDVSVSVPIAENIIYIFADVTGGLEKKSYRTITDENPFTSPAVKLYRNQSNDIVIDGGLKGNFSSEVSFTAMVKYSNITEMALFYNDTTVHTDGLHKNMFSVLYDDCSVFNIHAEVAYQKNEKLNIAFAFDQYSYKTDLELKAWHKPVNEARLMVKYNLKDKIQLNATLLTAGSSYARTLSNDSTPYVVAEKIKGFFDFNLGIEYRYSKVLSFYLNLNNLFFTKYERWYGYPREKFNLLGGLTYSF